MKPKSSPRHFLALAGSSLLAMSSAHAVDGTWSSTGNGTWSTSSNWLGSPNPVPGGQGSIVTIASDITGARNVTIDTSSRTVGSLTIGDASHGFTINASGGASLIFDNGLSDATLTENFTTGTADIISAPITLNSNLALTTNGSLTVSGEISGLSKSITKSGAGTLILTGNNSYSGGFTLDAGTIGNIGTGTYAGFGTGPVTINGGSLLFNSGANATIDNAMNWNGNFIITRGASSTPTITWEQDITLGANIAISGSAAGGGYIHNFNGAILDDNTGGRSLTFNATGTGGRTFITLNGDNTFTGGITIARGNLTIGGTGRLGGGDYSGNIGITSTATDPIKYSSSSDQILRGNITGIADLGLTKDTSSTSTLTLTGANTYSGATTISAGTIKFATQTALSNNVTANWTAARINVQSGGTLAFNVGGAGEFTTGNVTTLL